MQVCMLGCIQPNTHIVTLLGLYYGQYVKDNSRADASKKVF